MIDIKFNYRVSNNQTLDVDQLKNTLGNIKRNGKMNCDTLYNIYKNYKNSRAVVIHRFDTGKRTPKEESSIEFNKIIFIDFDYKNILNNYDGIKENFDCLYMHLITELSKLTYFYYGEKSLHGNSAHFLFYIQEVTNSTYASYYDAMRNKIYNILKKLGYGDYVQYDINRKGDSLIDNCGKSIYQLSFLTFNDCVFNRKCNGKLDFAVKIKTDKKHKQSSYMFSNKEFECIKIDDVDTVDYIDHTVRWQLFDSLSRMFEDNDLKEQWYRCANMIPTTRHPTQFYKEEPWNNDWADILTGDEWCDIDLVNKFGYHVKMTQYYKQPDLEGVLDELKKILN